MPSTPFDAALQTVQALVADFQAHESTYLAAAYQEAEVRKDFIDKFFIALGWDVNHETQHNPYQQEVKVERGVEVGAAKRRADYGFHIAPNFRDPRFMVEAKKPARDLANADDYFQTIRYGWNKGNDLAVLTDFEELHVLDCRWKPDIGTASGLGSGAPLALDLLPDLATLQPPQTEPGLALQGLRPAVHALGVVQR